MLCAEFENHECLTKVVIVETALAFKDSSKNFWIVDEDTDVLVILHEPAKRKDKVFLLKSGKDTSDDKIYSCRSFKYNNLNSIIVFIHDWM